MNSFERLNTALNHREPDRIPYDIAGTTVTGISRKAFMRAMEFRGLPADYDTREIDPVQQIVTPVEATLKKLNCDIRRLGARRIPDFEDIVKSQGNILEVTDLWGCLWKMDKQKDIYYNQYTYPLEKYNSIDEALKNYRIPDISAYAGIIREDLSAQAEQISDSGIIADRNVAGLTETSLRLRGYETWFIDTVTDPEGVEKLLDVVLDYKFQYWDLVIDWILENGMADRVNVIAECDDLGTQTSTLLEPDFLRKTVIARFRNLWTHIKSRLPGIKIFMHTCGSVRSLLPDLIEAGMDIYNPVQFTASGMDLKELKRDFGKDLVFWGGGVNTQSTLRDGSPAQIKEEVKKIIDILAPGGGFVFTTVHNIQEDVPPENFWAMWDTLMEYGKY
ncbi:MAG TPA: uroporphyrinogen decarboxylase family protein [Bacteroidales bacterium]|nr:uroporphyrinogen decarboxylase family protein [Bacteroidales bacterium]HPF02557.1 uroporphyrinogen decarboxylase family protein [Bacteroidales bacterium]HPJ60494.1 uroporphyrinogen decarboxylase family protein [Bacteroidales bacterium]HPR13266.1 uroporphyrinogen decarboxylase family protein [Bacteroidales bacterium]HRW84943.1 uroporphyrinogen decarboxylase family protein [Bacteroidales bacterium]